MELKEFTLAMSFAVQKQVGDEVEVCPQTVCKNNGVIWQGLSFRKKESHTAPTIYLEPYFATYQEGTPVDVLASKVAQCYETYGGHPDFDPNFFSDYEAVREKIVYKLIHYQKNEKLLSEIPHLKYLDLAVVFSCLISHSEIGMGSVQIRKSHLAMWNITAEMLFEDARRNTPKLLAPEFKSLSQVLMLPLEDTPGVPILHVLTNTVHMNGAAVILYEGVLETCAKTLGTNFFLLPSSIHEVLLLPYDRTLDVDRLRSIVMEANQTQVEPEERLSDSVYFYSREERMLRLL